MLPIVGLSACRKTIEPLWFHAVGEKFLNAVHLGAQAVPVILPALGDAQAIDAMLANVDGLLFTGSRSNVAPHHYGRTPKYPDTLHDPVRDAATLPMIPLAVERGIPLLAICRGCQEFNVAFGGTLHEHVHELEDKLDHRAQEDLPVDDMFAPCHPVALTPGGYLSRLLGKSRIEVNSLHGQGVEQLADGLVVEASAPDGLIEAFRMPDTPAFNLAVQWHPEWRVAENPDSLAIFQAFGYACRERASQRAART